MSPVHLRGARPRLLLSGVLTSMIAVVAGCGSSPPAEDHVARSEEAYTLDPTCTTTARYENGELITNARIFSIYWGHEWNDPPGIALRAKLDQAWSDLAANPIFYAPITRYSTPSYPVGAGSFLGSAFLGIDDYPASLKDVADMITFEISSGAAPVPDANTVFLLYTSASVGVPQVQVGNKLGQHNFFTGQFGGNTVNVKWAFTPVDVEQPDPGFVMCQMTGTVYNTITDPTALGWVTNNCVDDGRGFAPLKEAGTEVATNPCACGVVDGISVAPVTDPVLGCVSGSGSPSTVPGECKNAVHWGSSTVTCDPIPSCANPRVTLNAGNVTCDPIPTCSAAPYVVDTLIPCDAALSGCANGGHIDTTTGKAVCDPDIWGNVCTSWTTAKCSPGIDPQGNPICIGHLVRECEHWQYKLLEHMEEMDRTLAESHRPPSYQVR